MEDEGKRANSYQSKARPKEGGFGNTEGRALHKMDDDMWIKKKKANGGDRGLGKCLAFTA